MFSKSSVLRVHMIVLKPNDLFFACLFWKLASAHFKIQLVLPVPSDPPHTHFFQSTSKAFRSSHEACSQSIPITHQHKVKVELLCLLKYYFWLCHNLIGWFRMPLKYAKIRLLSMIVWQICHILIGWFQMPLKYVKIRLLSGILSDLSQPDWLI